MLLASQHRGPATAEPHGKVLAGEEQGTSMKKSRWYAIRVAPGYQRMAAADERLPESRQMESTIERNCRKDGFDIFMPSFYTELKHHRTNQIIQKRFPFLVGHAFVNLPRLNFEELRRVDRVMCFLRGANYGPLEFPDATIEFAEHERRQAFLYEQHCRKENERHEQIQHLRGQLRKVLPKPKGRKARVSMVDKRRRL
jgi:hypothetical protein